MGFLMNVFYKYRKLYSLFIVIVFAGCTQPLIIKNSSYDEPGYFMFGKTPMRNFYADIAVGEIIEKWNNQTSGSQSNSSIVIFNNVLFVYDLSGRIYGFDRLTGKLIGYEKFNGSIEVAPIIKNLRIFFIVNEKLEKYSTFIMFDFINGKVIKEVQFDGGVTNELIRLDNGIVILTNSGELIKFNYIGEREWSTKTETTSLSSPASNGEVIIWGNQSGEIIIASTKTGEIKSKTKIGKAISGGISIENYNAYFADEYGGVYCFDINKQKVIWKNDTGSKILSTPVFDKEKIYIGNLEGKVFALDKNNGNKLWGIETNGIINTTPLITKNMLIQPDVNKKVHLINSSDGKIESAIEFDSRTKLNPVYYNGMLYLGSDRGIIHAYEVYGVQ
jgi:outer membrane protein assembly factor BamB